MTKHITIIVAFLFGMFMPVLAQQKAPILTPLCDGFYVYTTYWNGIATNGIIAETEKGVVMTDAGWDTAQARELLDLVAARIGKPVVFCIVTHFHMDRVGGAALFKARGIKIVSTSYTASLAIKEGHAAPDGVLPPDTMFTVDGLQLVCYYPGPGHAPDNIVVWFPSQKVLFGGCFIKSADATSLGNMSDADVKEWPLSLHKVQQRFPDRKYTIAGHDNWNMANSLEHTLQLLGE